MPVFVVNEQVDVDSNVVHDFDVALLERVYKPCLVDVLLERVQFKVERLVLTHDWAPEV